MPRHPQYPWIVVLAPQPGILAVRCLVCRSQVSGPPPTAELFLRQHSAHQASATHYGAGDAVAAVAKPVARVLGRAPCAPCEQRRVALNRLLPRIWRR